MSCHGDRGAVGVMKTRAVDVLCSTVFVRSVRSYVRLCVHPFSINWIGWVSSRIRRPSHLPGAQKLLGGTHLKELTEGMLILFFSIFAHICMMEILALAEPGAWSSRFSVT